MLKKTFSFFCVLICVCALVFPTLTATAYEPTGVDLSASAAMLMSLDTNEVLYSKDPDKKVYPASIAKIMTVTLMLESDRFDPDAHVTMTEEVQTIISGTGSAVSNLRVGEEITQLDLVYFVLMASYGDCAYLAALYYGDSVENFVAMMNEKAQALGLTGTHYSNPVGLHDPETYTTVRDIAVLTEYALKNNTFQAACESARYTVEATNFSGRRTLSTTNFLQDPNTNYYYQYAHGVKTGYTNEAGRCLVSTAFYNGYRYLCIVMGCPPDGTRHFTDSANLYRWAFNNFSFKEVANSTEPVCEIPVELSLDTDFASLYFEKPFVTVLPNEADDSTILIKPHLQADSVDAPIQKGDVL
ncbi:MAG: D-alanyl-D-alanine carboxypeptidase, partial [Clostridia bacterium]|nr:D-alanyl-D-alanine carboxypeptidase [Clostridia bacterium]